MSRPTAKASSPIRLSGSVYRKILRIDRVLRTTNSAPKPSTKTSLTMKIDRGWSSVLAKLISPGLPAYTPMSRDSGARHQRQK